MKMRERWNAAGRIAKAGWNKLRQRRAVWIGAVAVASVALAAFLVVGTDAGVSLVDDVRAQVGAKPTLQELKQRARNSPDDAGAFARLGRANFEAGNRAAGLKAYDRALSLDKSKVDDVLLKDLVSCYGHKEQSRAHAILVKHDLERAERFLDDLADHPKWLVRTGAIQTIEKLGKITRDDYLKLWTTDLRSEECKVRQYAVEKLGELGDKRALDAIRAAKKTEDETTPWFTAKCLGGKASEAEKRILASR